MKPDTQRLLTLWRDQSDAFVDQLADDIKARTSSYAALRPDQFREAIRDIVRSWHTALETNDPAAIITHSHKLGLQQANDEVDVSETMHVIDALRNQIWKLM